MTLHTADREQQLCASTHTVRHCAWTSAGVLTLDVWQVLLVLVNLAAIDGEGQAFEQHGSLLQLSVSVGEQTQRAALRYSHSC